jgi:hypothetical protein
MAQAASLGAIARAKGGELLARRSITPAQCKVLRSIADCRTDALGGHRDRCDRCHYQHVFWNSCRDRHCPGCGAEAREKWLQKRREEVLDVPYFHVVFTIPESLNVLAQYAPAIVYAILLRAAGQALLDVAQTKIHALLGILAVLHTWGQTLVFHPHIHCIVPGGGFSLDGRRWIRVPTGTFLLHQKALSRRFRTHVKNAVTAAFDHGTLKLPASVVADRQALDLLLALASKTDWHSYVKPPFGGPEHVLAYLAAYTHRVGISNHRILSFQNDTVTFAYRDYKDPSTQKTMALPAADFLGRFLQHVVPPRFTRVRYYGFLSNRGRRANIAKARQLIGSSRKLPPRAPAPHARLCPQCKQGTLHTHSRIDPQRPRTWFDSS